MEHHLCPLEERNGGPCGWSELRRDRFMHATELGGSEWRVRGGFRKKAAPRGSVEPILRGENGRWDVREGVSKQAWLSGGW